MITAMKLFHNMNKKQHRTQFKLNSVLIFLFNFSVY